MELFDSYQFSNLVWCDQTKPWEYPDPTSRILCLEVNNQCGRDCTRLIIENGLVNCSCDDSWNCNLCANDVPFWIPFELGDTFDFQFQQPDELFNIDCMNGWLPSSLLGPTNTAFATFEIRSCCDDQVLEIDEELFALIAPNHYVGNYTTTDYLGNTTMNPIQMIRFNLAAISAAMIAQNLDPCFYIIFNFTGTRMCLPMAEQQNQFCSEPFKAVPCDGKTHVVESYYPRFDCFGNYFGTDFMVGNGNPFAYSNRVRIPSSFERTNFTITKETIGATLKTTSAQYCESWLMRTLHLPETFVKYLVNVFTGRDVYVDGVEYQIQGDIAKNNEIGSQWFLEAEFQRCECDKSLTCE